MGYNALFFDQAYFMGIIEDTRPMHRRDKNGGVLNVRLYIFAERALYYIIDEGGSRRARRSFAIPGRIDDEAWCIYDEAVRKAIIRAFGSLEPAVTAP